jgi:hypothetical protein
MATKDQLGSLYKQMHNVRCYKRWHVSDFYQMRGCDVTAKRIVICDFCRPIVLSIEVQRLQQDRDERYVFISDTTALWLYHACHFITRDD